MAELAQLERERDERVRRVLAQAEQRKVRREEVLRRLVQTRPDVPQGLVATLQRKGHQGQQHALLAWEGAKEAVAKLVEQAKRLVVRLLEAARPERLAAWARDHLQGEQLVRGVSERVPAATAKQPRSPLPPQPARQAKLPDLSGYSIEDQYRLYSHLVDQLKAVGQKKVRRVAVKVAKRLERRQTLASWSEADRPQKPHGLLAAFKKSEYDQAVKAYWQRQRRDQSLVEQAAKLEKSVLEATHRSENWAVRKLRSLQPEFTERVERYVEDYNRQVRMKELEATRKLQQERGIEGPQRSR